MELSPLVHRSFSLERLGNSTSCAALAPETCSTQDQCRTVLCTKYSATTNRMLRVATNGFMESLCLVLAIMEELDTNTAAP